MLSRAWFAAPSFLRRCSRSASPLLSAAALRARHCIVSTHRPLLDWDSQLRADLVAVAVVVCGSGLVAFRWWIAHREKSFASAPLIELQRRLGELEDRLTAGAMTRR